MNDYDKQFIMEFNEYFPFECFILSKPIQLNSLFDDMMLTEIFVPKMKNDYDNVLEMDRVFIKVKINGSTECRMAYMDFMEHIRETIRNIVVEQFGRENWENLYVEFDDKSKLKNALLKQKELIIKKYGECNIKEDFLISSTIKLLTE